MYFIRSHGLRALLRGSREDATSLRRKDGLGGSISVVDYTLSGLIITVQLIT